MICSVNSIVFQCLFKVLWMWPTTNNSFGAIFLKTLNSGLSVNSGLCRKSMNQPVMHDNHVKTLCNSSLHKMTLKRWNLELWEHRFNDAVFYIYYFNFTHGLSQMFTSSFGQHVKLQRFDEDCLRNLITVCAAAKGRNMPTEEKSNF